MYLHTVLEADYRPSVLPSLSIDLHLATKDVWTQPPALHLHLHLTVPFLMPLPPPLALPLAASHVWCGWCTDSVGEPGGCR